MTSSPAGAGTRIELGLALLDFLVTVFVKAGAPIRFAVDDTLFGRSGKRVWGAHYLHDGAQPEGSGRRTRWGNCWVVVVLVVEPSVPGRPAGRAAGPVPAVPTQGRRASTTGASQPELARALIDMILRRVPGPDRGAGDGRRVRQQGVARAARPRHASRPGCAPTPRVHKLAPARQPGQKGRPPLKGSKLPTLAEIAATATFTPVTDHRPRRARAHRARPRARSACGTSRSTPGR